MMYICGWNDASSIAPRTGAWVAISYDAGLIADLPSLLAQERGLQSMRTSGPPISIGSLLAQERGLQ